MFELIRGLQENRLLRLSKPSNYNARDISDLAFLYLVTLHLLRCEFETAPFAQRYAAQTNSHGGFMPSDPTNTDLYQFLHIISDPNGALASKLGSHEANELFWPTLSFSPALTRQLLADISKRGAYDTKTARRILLKLEQQLHIGNSNYKSMRRLAGEWDSGDLDTHQKQLVVTRMLQALRTRSRQGDLLHQLEMLAGSQNLELKNAANPETGEPAKGGIGSDASGWLKTAALMGGIYVANRALMGWRSGTKWRRT